MVEGCVRVNRLISNVAYASSLRFLPRKLEAYATFFSELKRLG